MDETNSLRDVLSQALEGLRGKQLLHVGRRSTDAWKKPIIDAVETTVLDLMTRAWYQGYVSAKKEMNQDVQST